jgi:hypothetical protein
MLHRRVAHLTAVLATVAFIAGCAGVRSGSDLAAAVAPPGDLSGTWYGTFGQVGAALYEGESNSVLRINPDGTFTATVTRGVGTNNLAKAATLAGTVAIHGERVTLRNSQGSWPWVTLTRSGDDVLYGLATDPAIQAPVTIKFERSR